MRTCKLEGCCTQFKANSSTTNLEYHLTRPGKRNHGLALPSCLDPALKKQRSSGQSVLSAFSFHPKEQVDLIQKEKIVVAYCMNIWMATRSFDNIYWKDAFKASIPEGLQSAKSLRLAIQDFSTKTQSSGQFCAAQ